MVHHSGHHKTSEVFELLEVVQFRCPDASMKYPQLLSNLRVELKIEEILWNSATSEFGSVYYYSERGDRLIDLDVFHQSLSRCHKNCTHNWASLRKES